MPRTLVSPQRAATAAGSRTLPADRQCRLCHDDRREEFDRQLSVGAVTDAAVAREIGVNRSSVTRHRRAHLEPLIAEIVTADAELGALDPLVELRALFERMKRHLATAEETGNLIAIRMIGGEVRAALELFGKFQALAAAGAAQGAVAPAKLEMFRRIEALSPEEREDSVLRGTALSYLEDPARFLGRLRNRAAVELSARRRIPLAEARTQIEKQESITSQTAERS